MLIANCELLISMPCFNIVAATTENTVVTEYKPAEVRADAYQSEAALEAEFIRLLTQQGYEDKPIHCEAELISNLRAARNTEQLPLFRQRMGAVRFRVQCQRQRRHCGKDPQNAGG